MQKLSMTHMSLEEQMDMVFRKMSTELLTVDSGTVIIHIRDNEIGKFGIRHNPIDTTDGQLTYDPNISGLSMKQVEDFRSMAVQSMKLKRGWTHGIMMFDFMVRKGVLMTSVQLESNYNFAAISSSVSRKTIRIR